MLLLRHRTYCSTQDSYWDERKRGAITELIRLIQGDRVDYTPAWDGGSAQWGGLPHCAGCRYQLLTRPRRS